MKFLIASDIHGNARAMRVLEQRIEELRPDKIVLLGDLLYHGPRNDLPQGYAPKEVIPLLNARKESIVAARGNCEAEVDQMVLEFPCMADCDLLKADGRTFFFTHGHLLDQPGRLPEHGDASVVMTGHTHVKLLEKRGDQVFLNPGSVGIPKDGCASYATYSEGVLRLHALEDGGVLAERAL